MSREDFGAFRDVHGSEQFGRHQSQLGHHIHMLDQGTRGSTLDLIADLEMDPVHETRRESLIRFWHKVEQCVHFLVQDRNSCLPNVSILVTLIRPGEHSLDLTQNGICVAESQTSEELLYK